MKMLAIKRALLSVTHKNGLIDFAAFLANNGVELVSTGGTRKMLRDAGLSARSVEEITGFPEILGGRVKTLHPKIHGGILASKDDPDHMETLASLDIAPFDLVCVNLYDFSSAIEKHLSLPETIEQIDIGGPCLLRAAAKNFNSVLVLPDPEFYGAAKERMLAGKMAVGLDFRKEMACRTFAATSRYDRMIADYLESQIRQ